jgi:hypothetical protein
VINVRLNDNLSRALQVVSPTIMWTMTSTTPIARLRYMKMSAEPREEVGIEHVSGCNAYPPPSYRRADPTTCRAAERWPLVQLNGSMVNGEAQSAVSQRGCCIKEERVMMKTMPR